MSQERDRRPGEIALELPATYDAGVYFIGRIRTPFKSRRDCPKSPGQSDAIGRVELDPRYAAGLALAAFLFSLGAPSLLYGFIYALAPLLWMAREASRFLYIAHFPVILAFQLLLRDVALPPLAKIAIALVGTIAVLMPVYRFAVRPTFIGAVLNGRRYPSTIRPVLEGGPHLEDRRAQDAVH